MNFKINALIITLSFFLYPFLTHSQRICYSDQNGHPISEQECKDQIVKEKLGWGYVKTDTAIVYQLSATTKQGKLPLDFVKKIRSALEKYSSGNIDSNSLLVIKYYTGIEHLLHPAFKTMKKDANHSITWAKYLQDLGNLKCYYIYSSALSSDNSYRGLYNNFRDELNIFDQFFALQYPSFSDIFIRPDGRYYIFYGVSVNEGTFNRNTVLKKMLNVDFDEAKL
ncbi:hypothetical protein [Pedobacter nototheniae]|uniref:hypothetical protein n=1 Tax=Pedobacter nototheniae TaxID=2488994 RepID=UPI00103C9589|nr:hypothetical protein [Pedobacter nototheniae]